MNKIIKPVAVCGLLMLAAAQANADITPYGRLDLSLGRETKSDNVDLISGFNTPSVFGVKGTRDLGGGVTGLFKLETANINAKGDLDGAFFGRAAYAGLSGDFGEVRAGRIVSVPFQVAFQFDLNEFSDSSAYIHANTSPLLSNNIGTRRSRQVQYLSPNLSGFRLFTGVTPKDSSGATNTSTLGAIGGTYTSGPLNIGAVYESASHVDGFESAADKGTSFVGGSYNFGPALLALTYMSAGTNPDFGAVNKGAGVGLQIPVAGFNIGAQYARNSASGVGAGELYLNKEIFKAVTFHVDYGQSTSSKLKLDGSRDASDSYFSVGVIYTF